MPNASNDRPSSVLIVAAHPDDPEFSSGGTLARWAREGTEVHYLVCTRGDKGTSDPDISPDTLMTMREAEQRAAAGIIGATTVEFLDCRDGEVQPTLALRGEIVKAIRRVRPEAVFTHDPATLYGPEMINHPDHIAVGQATLAAVYPTARDRLQFPHHLAMGYQPHKVTQVYLWGSLNPNIWIDITPTFETKVCALQHHVTQVGHRADLEKRMRERAAKLGEAAQVPLAEAFHRVVLAR